MKYGDKFPLSLVISSHRTAGRRISHAITTGLVFALWLAAIATSAAGESTAPVLAVNVNDPGRTPFQSMHNVFTLIDLHTFGFVFPTVPSGHRLVVQHVSGQMLFNAPTAASVTLTYLNDHTQLRGIFPVRNSQAFDHRVLVYYDEGENPLMYITVQDQSYTDLTKFVGVTMTGYLVDCSVAPCAAIER